VVKNSKYIKINYKMEKKLRIDGFKGFSPKNGTVLLEIPEKTAGGLILPNGAADDMLRCVAIGEDVTVCMPGDQIVGVGNGVRLKIDDRPYFLVYASGIMGIVEGDSKVILDIPERNPNMQ